MTGRVKGGLQGFVLETPRLDDAPRSGRPVEVDIDAIKTLTESNQCCTMQEIADIFRLSESKSYW